MVYPLLPLVGLFIKIRHSPAIDLALALPQASLEVIDIDQASMWWAGKELLPHKKLGDFTGKNEKTKIVAKLTKVKAHVFYNYKHL